MESQRNRGQADRPDRALRPFAYRYGGRWGPFLSPYANGFGVNAVGGPRFTFKAEDGGTELDTAVEGSDECVDEYGEPKECEKQFWSPSNTFLGGGTYVQPYYEPTVKDPKTGQKNSCSCDKRCRAFDDCCEDYFFYCGPVWRGFAGNWGAMGRFG